MREWIISTLGGGATALAIAIAIIGLAGALGGAAASYLVAQQTVYVTAITAERMKWVNALRENIATLTTAMRMMQIHAKVGSRSGEDALLAVEETTGLINTLILQLNHKAVIDKNIIRILSALGGAMHPDYSKYTDHLNMTLIDHSKWLLKMEWERIKYEARGWIGRLWHIRDQAKLLAEYNAFVTDNGKMKAVQEIIRPTGAEITF